MCKVVLELSFEIMFQTQRFVKTFTCTTVLGRKIRFSEVIFNHVLLAYQRCTFLEVSLKPKLESSVVHKTQNKRKKARAHLRELRLIFQYWW